MKKYSIAILVAALIALTAGSVSADVFNNNIENWTGYQYGGFTLVAGGARINIPNNYPSGPSFQYEHVLLDSDPSVDLAAGDVVNSATLSLGFYDGRGTEYTATSIAGGAWQLTGIDLTPDFDITVDWFTADGKLGVSIQVFNQGGSGVQLDY